MMKPANIPLFFTLLLTVAMPLALSGAEAPPPPEFGAPDAIAPPSSSGPVTAPGDGVDMSKVFAPEPGESQVPAPQISDEQMVKNAMDIALNLYHAEEYESCGKATAQILERYPKKPLYWVRYLQGLALEHQSLYLQAIENYIKVKEQAPRSTYSNAATFRRGLCELKSGQDHEAIYTLREIIETNPRSEYRLQAYVHLGNLYRRTRDWKAAQRIYKDLIRLYPTTAWSYMGAIYLAETYSHQGKREQAIKVYRNVERDPSIPITLRAQAQMRIADLVMGEERWQESIDEYRRAVRDYHEVPGIALMAEEKIVMATEGRRSGRIPYRPRGKAHAVGQAPVDEDYRLSQENEAVPYKN